MAVQSSPSLAAGKSSLIDPSRQAEYPILLGKSLREGTAAQRSQSLNVRYNWKSKQIPRRQVVTESDSASGSFNLAVQEGATKPIKYNGSMEPGSSHPESTSLALIFEKDKSAFVLESVSKSFNFNLTSATTKSNVDQLPQLETTKTRRKATVPRHGADDTCQVSEGSPADDDNPYDFRHFLSEAKRDASDKSPGKPQLASIESPGPGTSRPMTTSKSTNLLQSPFMEASKRPKPSTAAKPQVTRKKNDTSNQASSPISKAGRMTDKLRAGGKLTEKAHSSDEVKGSSSEAQAIIKQRQNESKRQDSTPPSHIIVDEASDLTIDMGSPLPAAKVKHKINPDAFSSNSRAPSRADSDSISPSPLRGDAGEDAERERKDKVGKGDSEDHDGADEADDDNDDDAIEDLSLPSPQATRGPTNIVSRISQDLGEDDDDDGLAAELEAAFEQEDNKDTSMIGLGISGEQRQVIAEDDEESEVSEEE